MGSHGKTETEALKRNLESQLDRLVEQLQDLENCRDAMDTDDYNETKEDTMAQLKELNESLLKMVKGDISLVSSLGAMQLATQAAVSEAFKTPEVIKLFARREPNQLRERLTLIQQDHKLNRMTLEEMERQKAEILVALRQLGDRLTAEELRFLEKFDVFHTFESVELVEVTE